MGEALWQRRRPTPDPHRATLGRWQPASPAELAAHRHELSAAAQDGARSAANQAAALGRLLLAFEELASNALRHGRGPVQVTVTTADSHWLLDVSDADAERPPSPAVGRDPADGGLGLYLVARISGAHGWTTQGERKHVWARIDFH
jgi:two-component sensor histidine kinase